VFLLKSQEEIEYLIDSKKIKSDKKKLVVATIVFYKRFEIAG